MRGLFTAVCLQLALVRVEGGIRFLKNTLGSGCSGRTYGRSDCSDCAADYVGNTTCSTLVYGNFTLASIPENMAMTVYEGENYHVTVSYFRSLTIGTSLHLYLVTEGFTSMIEIGALNISGSNGKADLTFNMSESSLYSMVSSRGYHWRGISSQLGTTSFYRNMTVLAYDPTHDMLILGCPGNGHISFYHRFSNSTSVSYTEAGSFSMSDNGRYGSSIALSKDLSTLIVCNPAPKSTYPFCDVYAKDRSKKDTKPYEPQYWSNIQTFSNNAWDTFGYSVVTNAYGNITAITALSSTNYGVVYVYHQNILSQSLYQSEDYMYQYGASLAMSEDGEVLVIGAPDYESMNSGKIQIFSFDPTSLTFNAVTSKFGSSSSANFGTEVWVSGDGKIVVGAEIHGSIRIFKKSVFNSWEVLQSITINEFSSYATGGISGSYDGAVIAFGYPRELSYGPAHIYVASPVDGKYTYANELYPGSSCTGRLPWVSRNGDSMFVLDDNILGRFFSAVSGGPWATNASTFDWKYIGLIDWESGMIDYRNLSFVQKSVTLQPVRPQEAFNSRIWVAWTSSHPYTKITLYLFYPVLTLDSISRSNVTHEIIIPSGYSSTPWLTTWTNISGAYLAPFNLSTVFAGLNYSLCAILEGDQYFVRGSCASPILFYCRQARYGSRCENYLTD